jgi:hypothetical protein
MWGGGHNGFNPFLFQSQLQPNHCPAHTTFFSNKKISNSVRKKKYVQRIALLAVNCPAAGK